MFCISVSYRKAPLAVRERFAFLPEEQEAFLERLYKKEKVSGAVVLSTCSRCEIYVSGSSDAFGRAVLALAEARRVKEQELRRYGLCCSGGAAVRHLFLVCAGLDSMVLGEDEILHQVREAYRMASECGSADGELNIVFQAAFRAAKRAKSQTALSTTPLSIGTLTANEIEHYLTSVKGIPKENGTVLVIGAAGKIGSIVAKDLLAKGIPVIGASRKERAGADISKDQARMRWIRFADRYQWLQQADAVVSATVSPQETITGQEYRRTVPEGGQKLLVDLAVPGDIDRTLQKESGITFLDIDFFRNAARANRSIRLTEKEKAEHIIEECTEETLNKLYLWEFKSRLNKLKKSGAQQ